MTDPTDLPRPSPPPRALDICAGAGGLSLGLTRAGFDVRGLELDPDACDTHRRHVGPCECADLRTWFPPHHFDLVAGGPPCQPFSVAGLGLADADERYLIPDFLRIARHAHARAIMIENVRGLVTRHPRVFRAVLDACEAEYFTTWTILNAAHYGVPQNRERLFIFGFRDAADRARFRWPLPSHAPPGELFGAPHRTVRQALDLPPADADALDRPAPCVTATEHKSAMRGTQPMNRRRRASERLSEALGSLDRPAPAVRPNAYHDAPDPERASRRPMAELSAALVAAGLADRPSTTVDTKPTLSRAGRGHRDPQKSGAVRLSPQQCAVLQAFPPGWTFTGNKSSQHRQIGNAVPPPLGEAVAHSIRVALTE